MKFPGFVFVVKIKGEPVRFQKKSATIESCFKQDRAFPLAGIFGKGNPGVFMCRYHLLSVAAKPNKTKYDDEP